MSLVTIPTARNLRRNIEVEGFVKGLEPTQYVNLHNGRMAAVSNGFLMDGNGNSIRVSFWNDDIKKVRNNLKIRITDAVTKKYLGEISLHKGRHGSIDILDFNPDKIFDDIQRFQQLYKDNKSFSTYYDFVKCSKSDIYLGIRKFDYLSIIDAFITIELARKNQTKQNRAEVQAIHYLHQKITLSPVRIRQILWLFQINIDISRILRISDKWNEGYHEPNYVKFTRKHNEFVSENSDKKPIFGYSDTDLPEEISIDENFVVKNSDRPLCEADQVEFHRKYRGYINFYSDPW
jgi:hypothetical protein